MCDNSSIKVRMGVREVNYREVLTHESLYGEGKVLQKNVAEQIEGNRVWGSQKRNRVF